MQAASRHYRKRSMDLFNSSGKMFTGIVEAIGEIRSITEEGTNRIFRINSSISHELKPDQSVSHNGVCLTVTRVRDDSHYVTAIEETLQKSNLAETKVGDKINLERSLTLNSRLDGHLVQGHVDQIAFWKKIKEKNGSWAFNFYFEKKPLHALADKGSICINGVSLTIAKKNKRKFSVAIIPFTYEHTNFSQLLRDQKVNIEFDIIGKYVEAMSTHFK
jgi:riboflavin synthase